MGTSYRVAIPRLPAGVDRRVLRAEISSALETVNRQMSNWRADSEISIFNAGAPRSWTGISPDTLTVVDKAIYIGRLSEGAFDPTIGPLVDLWGFGPGAAARRVPPRDRIEAALARIGFQHLRTRKAPPAIDKARRGIGIDLCGIAKGFGVDKLAERLEARGVRDYLVEIGGDLRVRGQSARRQPWRIGMERPTAGRRAVQRIVALDGGAIATSGNYRNFFNNDGTRYSHIIDPRTGAPAEHALASVTVIAPTTMEADGWSTALMVLGPEAGLRLAKNENLAALFIVNRDGRLVEKAAPAFDRYRFG
jgi:thiamine biosynthesis lipoprotein